MQRTHLSAVLAFLKLMREGHRTVTEVEQMVNKRAGQANAPTATPLPAHLQVRFTLLYHFCRLQMTTIALAMADSQHHLERAFSVFHAKPGVDPSWTYYLDNLYPLDWFLASACLDGNQRAWESLFAAKAGRSDCLLMDALRAGRPAFMLATRKSRIAPSTSFGAISSLPNMKARCRCCGVTMASGRWCPG